MSTGGETARLQTILELVSYYKDIFILTLVSLPVSLTITFRRAEVKLAVLTGQSQKYLRKISRKLSHTLELGSRAGTGLS